MTADPKPAARIRDPKALRAARLRETSCAACGWLPGSVHHVLPRSERGDDSPGNLVVVCGSGTTRCHGALHGNPYVGPDGVRRDSAWVRMRIGRTILRQRRDVIDYLTSKLGEGPGLEYLRRAYYSVPL